MSLPIGHSPEVFEAYAIIDYCYFCINKINEEINKPLSPIEMAVDVACGYNRVSLLKEYLNIIIENKKIIEADYSKDESFLKQLSGLV